VVLEAIEAPLDSGLGAGGLEAFLGRHGEKVIDGVEPALDAAEARGRRSWCAFTSAATLFLVFSISCRHTPKR